MPEKVNGRKGRALTDEEKQKIRYLYVEEERSVTDISVAINRKRDCVRRTLVELAEHDEQVAALRALKDTPQRQRIAKCMQNAKARLAMQEPIRKLHTVKTDKARAKLYNGHRYEDADVPKAVPRCGRLG